MSATNSTTNYNLPIFIASDSPKWLVDWNGAMNTIDSAINTVATAASGAAGDITTLQSDLQTLSGTVTTQGTSISTLTSSLSTLTGTVNTITSLIGNGEPTTTDKTIIGAINELHAEIGGGGTISVDADEVTYDNTLSGLLATNVQSAIDELKNEIPAVLSRRIISIGDSYAVGTNTYNDILATLFNLDSSNFYKLAEGSMGFVRQGSSGHTALTLLQSESSNITGHNTISDIIVSVGGNDAGSDTYVSGFSSAITSFVNYCKSEYPNAKIHYAFLGSSTDNPNTTADTLHRMYGLISTAYSKFTELGCDCMTGSEVIMHDATNISSSDWVHPNTKGSQEIAKFIYKWMIDGYALYQTYAFYQDSTNNSRVEVSICGRTTTIRMRPEGSGVHSTSHAYEAMTLDNSVFPVRGSTVLPIYGTVPYSYSGKPTEQYLRTPATITGGKLIVQLADDNTAYNLTGEGVLVCDTIFI